MTVTLPPDLEQRVATEVANGGFETTSQLVEEAVRQLLATRLRARGQREAIENIGRAVDQAGLYDRVLVPADE